MLLVLKQADNLITMLFFNMVLLLWITCKLVLRECLAHNFFFVSTSTKSKIEIDKTELYYENPSFTN